MIWHDLANHHGEYHSLDHWIVHARFMDHGHPMMDSEIYDGSPQQKSRVAPSSFRTAKHWLYLLLQPTHQPYPRRSRFADDEFGGQWDDHTLHALESWQSCKDLHTILLQSGVIDPQPAKHFFRENKIPVGGWTNRFERCAKKSQNWILSPNFFGINIKQSLRPSPRKRFDKICCLSPASWIPMSICYTTIFRGASLTSCGFNLDMIYKVSSLKKYAPPKKKNIYVRLYKWQINLICIIKKKHLQILTQSAFHTSKWY